jgi:hypothetical protein
MRILNETIINVPPKKALLKGSLRAERCSLKKSIFSIENGNIPQLFLLDKLVSGQDLK